MNFNYIFKTGKFQEFPSLSKLLFLSRWPSKFIFAQLYRGKLSSFYYICEYICHSSVRRWVVPVVRTVIVLHYIVSFHERWDTTIHNATLLTLAELKRSSLVSTVDTERRFPYNAMKNASEKNASAFNFFTHLFHAWCSISCVGVYCVGVCCASLVCVNGKQTQM